MQRDFETREDLIAYLREEFPNAAAVDGSAPETVGGRAEAEHRLGMIDPVEYAKTRNHMKGAVTHLSPYHRHGVLTLAETRDHTAAQLPPENRPGKLIQELAWRDYFQRVYAELGAGIWKDREPYKTGFAAEDYSEALPENIREGQTGLACMDAFADDLSSKGYLHNHARMWMAAYVVHWRRVKWQAGARWFLQHLLDGDPASNNLSWQWVASTFSHKPYFFNRDNLEKYTDGEYCETCPARDACPFNDSYPALEQKLFPNKPPSRPRKPPKPRKGKRKRWHQ